MILLGPNLVSLHDVIKPKIHAMISYDDNEHEHDHYNEDLIKLKIIHQME